MKLLIIGANGKTGRALVQQAVERGHQVTALVHHPPRLPLPSARILQGDARDPALMDIAVAAQDAVIDTLGTRKPFLKTTLETDAARNIIRAMHHHGVRRLIAVSSIGVGDSIANVKLLFRLLIPLFFRGAMPDKEGMEAELRSSNLDWTIVRPAGLTDDPPTNDIHVISPQSRRHVFRIPRADVAAFILTQLEQGTLLQQTVAIANR
ncbi:MAG TPA: SDR family oxidoreductase [Acidobacteriaceae bacterium]|jgi:putative NADH-flavin reductase|nr:SDR family oxidoreductase [Acidobacteriaceae bacterium]